MFQLINDIYLKYHVKAQLKNYYTLLGINPKDLERKTMAELLEMVEKLVAELQKQNEMLQQTVKKQEKEIELLKLDKEMLKKDKFDLQIRNEELFARNERLSQRLYISMNQNLGHTKEQSNLVQMNKAVGRER